MSNVLKPTNSVVNSITVAGQILSLVRVQNVIVALEIYPLSRATT